MFVFLVKPCVPLSLSKLVSNFSAVLSDLNSLFHRHYIRTQQLRKELQIELMDTNKARTFAGVNADSLILNYVITLVSVGLCYTSVYM